MSDVIPTSDAEEAAGCRGTRRSRGGRPRVQQYAEEEQEEKKQQDQEEDDGGCMPLVDAVRLPIAC